MDEELRALEQRSRASPDDTEAAVRFGLALARRGERDRAALVLAEAVDRAPASEAALRALDEVAPGGFDPRSAWPCRSGDARGTRRSGVRAPARLAIGRRVTLSRELDLRSDLVDDAGMLLVVDPRGLGDDPIARPVVTDFTRALEAFFERPPDPARLIALDLEGRIHALPGEAPAGDAIVLAGHRVVVPSHGPVQVLGAPAPEGGGLEVVAPWTCGLGHLVSRSPLGPPEALEAFALGSLEKARWRREDVRGVGTIALGARARVLVHARESLSWLDLATGETRARVDLEPAPAEEVIEAPSGVVLLGHGNARAVSETGEVWRRDDAEPIALAGAKADVVLAREVGREDAAILGLSLEDGGTLWRTPAASFHGRPKIDATGRIAWRREDALVLLSPETGEVGASVEVGGGWRDFVFAADGKIAVLRRTGVTRTELVVLSE